MFNRNFTEKNHLVVGRFKPATFRSGRSLMSPQHFKIISPFFPRWRWCHQILELRWILVGHGTSDPEPDDPSRRIRRSCSGIRRTKHPVHDGWRITGKRKEPNFGLRLGLAFKLGPFPVVSRTEIETRPKQSFCKQNERKSRENKNFFMAEWNGTIKRERESVWVGERERERERGALHVTCDRCSRNNLLNKYCNSSEVVHNRIQPLSASPLPWCSLLPPFD